MKNDAEIIAKKYECFGFNYSERAPIEQTILLIRYCHKNPDIVAELYQPEYLSREMMNREQCRQFVSDNRHLIGCGIILIQRQNNHYKALKSSTLMQHLETY